MDMNKGCTHDEWYAYMANGQEIEEKNGSMTENWYEIVQEREQAAQWQRLVERYGNLGGKISCLLNK